MEKLEKWFQKNKRSFIFREKRSPYSVFISEVMLQQTQAERVVPYFVRWMERFPNIETLAKASEEEVIKLWEGLGYYRRARSLLSGAKDIVARFGGHFPSHREALYSIKGLGPYTVEAILAFGFQYRAAPLDANVMRVLSRLFMEEGPVDVAVTRKKMQKQLFELLPEKNTHIAAEAFIELGAVLCTKTNPQCAKCPLQGRCLAYREKAVEGYPRKKRKVIYEKLQRDVFVIETSDKVLLKKPVGKGLMAGLYELPYREHQIDLIVPFEAIYVESFEKIEQSFTRYRVTLYPHRLKAAEFEAPRGCVWINKEELSSLPFSSGHKKVLQLLIKI